MRFYRWRLIAKPTFVVRCYKVTLSRSQQAVHCRFIVHFVIRLQLQAAIASVIRISRPLMAVQLTTAVRPSIHYFCDIDLAITHGDRADGRTAPGRASRPVWGVAAVVDVCGC
jgi:hypothetical protein